jgi:predicted MPP superfamily phosphohydrolase
MSDDTTDFRRLAARLGPSLLRQRLHRQANLRARLIHQGEGPLAVERVIPVDHLITRILRFTGFAARGRANCLRIEIVTRDQPLPNLPPAFDGFRLLQLSDLHLDCVAGFADRLIPLIEQTPHDLAVITGDFADHPAGYFHDCLGDIRRIADALRPGALAVLGNHDIIEIVPHLEAAGLRVLLNENTAVERDGQYLHFSGLDDPHFYRTHDFEPARRGIPQGACGILLAHSPEVYDEALHYGFNFMLAGHTHGGQICLPGGIALVRNGRCPTTQFTGAWTHHGLHGYTSRGTGSCGVPARFNCPPEMTVHVLRTPQSGSRDDLSQIS